MGQSITSEITSIYGGFWRYNVKDFCYLVNPYFPTPEMLAKLRINLKGLVKSYPSGYKNISFLLSQWIGINPDNIIVGNGASELIEIIMRHLVKRLTLPLPTFNEYEVRLKRSKINYFPCKKEDFSLDMDDFVKSINISNSNAALLINPNNPTGAFTPVDHIKFLLKRLKSLDLFILDESFIECVSGTEIPTMEEFIYDYKNLLIIKSMSKVYGIPGLRLGYVVTTNKRLLSALRRELPIWNVNSISEFFLELLLKYKQEYRESRKAMIKATEKLYQWLSTEVKYLHAYPTKANFVFAEITNGITSTELRDLLLQKARILIKDCSNKIGLNNKYIRLASRTLEENRELINTLKSIL